MSGISANSNIKIQSLMSLTETKISEIPPENRIKLDSLQLPEDKVSVNQNLKGSFSAELKLTDNSSNSLPPVRIKNDGDFTFSYNAYNRGINAHKEANGTTFNTLSKDGMSVILAQNNDKRDVLVFSNMNNKISKNSLIPNVYFYIDGKGKSDISFDKDHNLVINLKNNEKIVIDGKDGQTVLSGPFKIDFNSESPAAKDFKVNYTGSGHLQKFSSLGDKIKW